MKSNFRLSHVVLIGMVALSIALLSLPTRANQKTPFNELPVNDPKRVIIQTILRSPQYSMRSRFSPQEWRSGHYGGAWERARQYFPNNMFFVESDEYFMTHGFSAKGRLFIEVYNSAYLQSCVENYQTFQDRNIVNSYNQMLASGNDEAVRSFQEKMGQLESYFRDEASKNHLKKMLGTALYNQLLKELREENYHMFAAALLHEGMHAKMDDDKTVARIQNEYNACTLPVQWDELRAYMAEVNYHSQFYSWAVNNIFANWGQIAKYLGQLEKFRNKPKPLSEQDKEKIEEIKAKIKAHIALIRLRMRELWQSVQRMNSLLGHFKTDYIKDNAPAETRDMIDKLAMDIANFVTQVSTAIQNYEQMLRDLEQVLKLWNEWADCTRPDPPDKDVIDDIVKRGRGFRWPAPPVKQVQDIRKKADDEIVKNYGVDPAGRPEFMQGLTISGGFQVSSVSMKTINNYIDFLNITWLGDVAGFDWNTGFRVSLGWRFSPHIEVGAAFERQEASTSGRLVLPMSQYTSEHILSMYGIYITGMTREVVPRLRLTGQFGLGYYVATYRETEDSFVTEGDDTTIGWSAAAGMDYALSTNFSLTLQTGYRSATLDDFGVSFFMPESPPAKLEFSGPYGQIGLSIRF